MNQTLLQTYQDSASAPIAKAESLPPAVYSDTDVFNQETASVFLNDWVFLCAEAKLGNPGDYFAINLAGEPVAVIRGRDGQLRALSNVCRHRGTPLLDDGFGTLAKHIVCPYHAWTFDDTGEFIGAPLTGVIKPDKAQHCLPVFAVECWQGLVFINLSRQPEPLTERLAGLDNYLGWFELSRFKEAYQMPAEQWNANWKLAVENGIESYHLFKVHKETLETVTPSKQAYYVAGSSEWSLTGGLMKDQRSTLTKWFSGKHPEAYNHYLLIFLPPSFIGILSYDGLHWIQVLPVDAEHCIVTAGGLSEHKISSFEGAEFDFTRAFLEEDKQICERVQRATHARIGRGGKLVELEQILVDFRHYLGNRLFGSQPEAFRETGEAKRFLYEATETS